MSDQAVSDEVVSGERVRTRDGEAIVQVRVRLHGVLAEHAGGRRELEVPLADGATVGDLLDRLAADHPAVERRIRDETGALRQHVNVFVGTDHVRTLGGLAHRLRDGAEVLVLPAVSGG